MAQLLAEIALAYNDVALSDADGVVLGGLGNYLCCHLFVLDIRTKPYHVKQYYFVPREHMGLLFPVIYIIVR